MKTLFQLAEFYMDKGYTRAEFMSHNFYLVKAAKAVTDGYSDLEEAEQETQTRIDPYGNEIEPSVVNEAARFLSELVENIGELQDAAKP